MRYTHLRMSGYNMTQNERSDAPIQQKSFAKHSHAHVRLYLSKTEFYEEQDCVVLLIPDIKIFRSIFICKSSSNTDFIPLSIYWYSLGSIFRLWSSLRLYRGKDSSFFKISKVVLKTFSFEKSEKTIFLKHNCLYDEIFYNKEKIDNQKIQRPTRISIFKNRNAMYEKNTHLSIPILGKHYRFICI